MSNVLLLGASGFIGRHVLRALQDAGHEVSCGVRTPGKLQGCRAVQVDYARDRNPGDWLPRLGGIEVVINAVGILRETRGATFQALHVDAPRALFAACVEAGVKKVIQISALGADEGAVSRYHVTKKQADDALAALPIVWVIVQPSLVFGEGGTSARLFTVLAALPFTPLPGRGEQRVQPIYIDDLSAAIVRLVDTAQYDRERVPAVGARAVRLREFLATLRRAMRLGQARFVPVPMALMRLAALIAEKLPRALFDREVLGMLMRGNTACANAITKLLGRPPRAIESFIPCARARAAADQARLAWLLPLLRACVGIVWIATGIVSLGVYPVEESYALLGRVGLTGVAARVALYGAALLDLAFGIGVFALRNRRWLWRAQMLLIVAYSVIIAVYLPEFWLHPYGPMLKNVPLLVAILLLHEFERPQ